MSHDTDNADMRRHAIFLTADRAAKALDMLRVQPEVSGEDASAFSNAAATARAAAQKYKFIIDGDVAP